MMGRGLAEAGLRGDSSEGKELDVSGASTLQIVGTFGDMPFLLPQLASVLGTPCSLPTYSGSSQPLWEGHHLGGSLTRKIQG